MSRIFMAMNGKRLNTLEELRENFNSAQAISFYRGGRLQNWLEEIGAADELENIKSFDEGYDDDTLLSMLMAVFELSDEQIAAITAEKEKAQDLNTQSPVEEVQPVVIAENAPPAPEPETVAEADVYSATDLKIKWSFCGIAKTGAGNSVTAETLSFEELPEKGTLPRLGKVKCEGLCFADGYFVGCFTANSYLGLGLSSDGIHWNMEERKELCEGTDVTFRDTDISFIVDDPNDFSGYIQIGNRNWQKVSVLSAVASSMTVRSIMSQKNDNEQRIPFWVLGNNIFYKEIKTEQSSLDFSTVLSKYSYGKGWTKCELPGNLPYEHFFIAESGGYFFVPSANSDGEFCSDVLMYSSDGKEWSSYDFSEIFGKKWQKIKNAVSIGHIAFGNNRIIVFDPRAQHYLLGEIIS